MIPFQEIYSSIHGHEVRQFRFEPPYQLLDTLFSVEVRRSKRLFEAIESVITGQVPGMAFTGNVLSLHIGQLQTVVMDALAPDGVGDACVVATKELAYILRLWYEMV